MAKDLNRVQGILTEEFPGENLIAIAYDRDQQRLRWMSNSDTQTLINILREVLHQLEVNPRPEDSRCH